MTSKTKTTLGLIIFLVILLGLYLLWQNPLDQQNNNNLEETLINSDLSQLQKVEISKAGTITTLVKENDQWLVESDNKAVANTVLIDKLITDLINTKNGTLVSANSEKYPVFGLDEESVLKIKLTNNQGQLINELWLGQASETGADKYYGKKIDSANVLLIKTNLPTSATNQDWKQPPPTTTTNDNTNSDALLKPQ